MRILSFYIGRIYVAWFLIILVGMLGVVFVFDTIELMRRAGGQPDTTLGVILTMGLLNLPSIGEKILPFIALFAAMFTLWRLTRSQELIIVRAIGVSIWQMLTPIWIATFALALFYLFTINPLGALMKKSYRELENKYIDHSALLDLSSSGLWLRQTNGDTRYLFHAETVTTPPLTIRPLIVFMYDKNGAYKGRIDAEAATLLEDSSTDKEAAGKKQAVKKHHVWHIEESWLNVKNHPAVREHSMDIPTDLTMDKIQESMAPPNTISFWELPGFIEALEATGFPGVLHRMQFYGLLALPFFLCAMVLCAACFSLQMLRRGGAFSAALAGLFVGSFAFGFNEVVLALGANVTLPTLLAAFATPLIAISIGGAALLHLEDG